MVFEPGALNYFTSFCHIPLTLSVSRNPILTHLPLSESLDSLICLLIAPIPGLAFSLDATHAIGGIINFVRQGLSFSELSTSSLYLFDPHYDYVGVNISFNKSSSLSFLNVYALPIRFFPTDGRTDSFSPSTLLFSRNLFILADFNCPHPLWVSRGTFDPREEEVFG